MPETFVAKQPFLCVFRAWISTITSKPLTDVKQHITKTQAALNRVDDSYPIKTVKGHIKLIQTYSERRSKKPHEALTLLQEAGTLIPEDSIILQSTLKYDIGRTYWLMGRFLEAERLLQETRSFEAQPGTLTTMMGATSDLAEIYIHIGRLRQAMTICKGFIEQSNIQLIRPLCYIQARLGIAYYQLNEIEMAQRILQEALTIGRQVFHNTSIIASLTALVWLKLSQGKHDEANLLWDEVKQAYADKPLYYGDFEFDYHQVKLWLVQDNLDAASDWAFHYTQQETERNNWYIRLDIVLARVRLAEKKLDNALEILEAALNAAKKEQLMGWYMEGLILQATVYSRKRKKDYALLSLAEALSLAEPEGYVRIVVDEGDALTDLLSDLIAKYRDYSKQFSFSVKYASDLLAIIKAESQLHFPLAEPLTEREFDVLHLLAAGLSNQEVADKLFITLGTVKQYNHIIYRKLDVRTRNQAVQRAKDLNLL